jgi:toxin ParE1/3/4
MPKNLISITESAEHDLSEIVYYIASNNPAATLKLAENIEKSILLLQDFPLTGATPKNRRLTRQGYRILIVDRYLVFYVLLNNEIIEIQRIISGKRKYKFLL